MKLLIAVMYVVAVALAFKAGRDWEEDGPAVIRILKRLRTWAAVRLVAALIALAGVIALTGCSADVVDPGAAAPACYPPLACGALYPVAYYPYYAHPYIGLIHDPAHVIITGAGSRTTVIYRPYSPPVRPGFLPVPKDFKPAPQQPAKPAAPAAKPAAPAKAPAPRPAAPAPRSK